MMGKDVGRLDAAARRTLGFAFVPEDRLGRGAVPEMSLVLNSLLTAHPLNLLKHGLIDRARATAFTNECIRQYDVRTPGPDAEAGSLSGGNLQKFIVGREIMLSPKLLFVAQPTWGVDIGAASAIRQPADRVAQRRHGDPRHFRRTRGAFRALRFHPGPASREAQPAAGHPRHAPEEIGRYMIGAQCLARESSRMSCLGPLAFFPPRPP